MYYRLRDETRSVPFLNFSRVLPGPEKFAGATLEPPAASVFLGRDIIILSLPRAD